ncbi:MAG: hypothetical protein OEU32_00505 [Acidimicrobiia bacterium]|nr:hypothetical protein [Acidimicrobiia bacterium]
MSNWGYIIVGWSAAAGVLGAYAVRLVTRGRSLSRRVPPERRRWMG